MIKPFGAFCTNDVQVLPWHITNEYVSAASALLATVRAATVMAARIKRFIDPLTSGGKPPIRTLANRGQ
jgi:hypothetical protein